MNARLLFPVRGSGPRTLLFLALVAPLLASPIPVAAEDERFPRRADPASTLAAVAGRVLDARSGEPVPDVRVRLQGTSSAGTSDSDGRFTFDGVAVGQYLLVVEHIAYETIEHPLTIEEPTATYEVVIRLDAEAIQVDPVEVEIVRSTPLADVYDRLDRMERLGLGTRFDRQAIERSGASRATQLVSLVPGASLRPLAGRVGASQIFLHPRNNCGPSIYIDGIRTPMADESLDDYVTLSAVETLEVYRRLSMLPGEYADEQAQNCGAVVVWTRRGAPALEPFGWRRAIALTTFVGFTWLVGSVFF